MKRPGRLALIAAWGVAACTPFPDLDDRVTPAARTAPFPTLVATDPIVAAHGGPVDPAPIVDPVQARVDALTRRAEQVQQGPVIDDATLARLEAARAAAAAQTPGR